MKLFTTTLLAMSAVTACAPSKVPVSDEFTELSGMDDKSDAFSYRMKTLGTIAYGETSAAMRYTRTPRFRAWKFEGHEGDRVDAWVRSSNGDAVAWVLDKSFHVLGANDDANDTTLDAHVVVTLPASASTTHYIVFRDYDLLPGTFRVELAGGPPYDTSCAVDADCVAVSSGGCCPHGVLVAVSAGAEDDYAAASACTITPHPLCRFATILDRRVAECNNASHHCEMVEIEDIACGGFLQNSHQCPDGFACHLPVAMPDRPGSCVAQP